MGYIISDNALGSYYFDREIAVHIVYARTCRIVTLRKYILRKENQNVAGC